MNPNRDAFLKQNEIEKKNLDREIAMLEKKLGLKKGADSEKKRRKLNQTIEVEGFGTGFMDFINGIEAKVDKMGEDDYVP